MRPSRTALIALSAALVAPSVAAYRFAVEYRRRAGFPARRPPLETPAAYGLPFDVVAVPSDAGPLPGWFVPAPGGRPAPVVVLVHGWESNRARMLPNARFLHAAGFATLMFDVRGHGDNPPETLPISGAEFGADARAAAGLAADRPDVTAVAVLGHSMGAIGAAIAAADDPRIAALVTTAAPADPRRLTRRTFQLAGLTMPGPVANPLAALTTRVYLRPRGHAPSAVSAAAAVVRYAGPILIVHGARDEIVGPDHAVRLDRAASDGGSRSGTPDPAGGSASLALRGRRLSRADRGLPGTPPGRRSRAGPGSRARGRDAGSPPGGYGRALQRARAPDRSRIGASHGGPGRRSPDLIRS